MKIETHFSNDIKVFCDKVEQAKKDYNYAKDKIDSCDKIIMDYLHKIEFGGLKYKERAKLATQLKKIRNERREYKDQKEALQPLIEFLTQNKSGADLLKNLRQVQGECGKVEKNFNMRAYIPKGMSIEEYEHLGE